MLDDFSYSPEYQFVSKFSTFDATLSAQSGKVVDRVSEDCEKILDITLAAELRQRVMGIVGRYRDTLKDSGSVSSYEALIRACMIIVLREAGYVFPLRKLVNSQVILRMLMRVARALDIDLPKSGKDVLFLNVLEKVEFSSPLQSVLTRCLSLGDLMIEYGGYPVSLKLSHCVAICYFVLHEELSLSFRSFVALVNMKESEKSCYKELKRIKVFARKGLELIGIRTGIGFFSKFNKIVDKLKDNKQIQLRLV